MGGGPDELDAWVAGWRADQAVQRRAGAGRLQRQALEMTTLTGVLRELGERGGPVLVELCTARRLRGTIESVGRGHVLLHSPSGAHLINTTALVTVRPLAGEAAVPGEAAETGGGTLAGAIAALAGRGQPVTVHPFTGETLRGTLEGVGRDVCVVRLDAGGVAYVALGSLAEVSAAESG